MIHRSVFDSYFFRLKERLTGQQSNNSKTSSSGESNTKTPPSMFKLLGAGAAAGATTKTCVAPLERIKILFQIQGMMAPKQNTKGYRNIGHAFKQIYQNEGVLSFWKGNGTNVRSKVARSCCRDARKRSKRHSQLLAGLQPSVPET